MARQITISIPLEIYEIIELEAKANGKTVTELVAELITAVYSQKPASLSGTAQKQASPKKRGTK